jgi:hypothetical protein
MVTVGVETDKGICPKSLQYFDISSTSCLAKNKSALLIYFILVCMLFDGLIRLALAKTDILFPGLVMPFGIQLIDYTTQLWCAESESVVRLFPARRVPEIIISEYSRNNENTLFE